ncbi:hypothetical protein [Thiomicrorhabdus lithotrophica]|uniref:Uncharacterized protein n=1 Tax=Thiomicrorhabdus lithotrophica TaxID=2949997 RepID=A0ABY8C7B1_9GAMM|nr:hypothetical protein [Thiomicrorhabdus lithotrophica]WEJ61853.1 hypothetical protein NR989_07470 [Thiomicrorhabdus lithotrophica]
MQLNSKLLGESIDGFTKNEIEFLTSKDLLAVRMRYLLAALQGYRLPWMLAEVLLQSNDSQRELWQRLEEFFVYSKKSSEPKAKEINALLNQFASQGWAEFRIEKARLEGVDFARSMDPSLLAEQGQQLQFSENPYREENIIGSILEDYNPDVQEAWREGFHNYLCLIREESW